MDYAREAAAWYEDYLPVQVNPHQVRPRLTGAYRATVPDAEINHLSEIFADDIFLLRLALDQTKAGGRLVGPAGLAEYVWGSRTNATGVDQFPAHSLKNLVCCHLQHLPVRIRGVYRSPAAPGFGYPAPGIPPFRGNEVTAGLYNGI